MKIKLASDYAETIFFQDKRKRGIVNLERGRRSEKERRRRKRDMRKIMFEKNFSKSNIERKFG